MANFGSVYEALVEYFGYRVFFHFSDPMEAIKFKHGVEEALPEIEVRIRHFKVMHELPKDFVETTLEIFSKIDQMIIERRIKENDECVSDVPCEACDS